MRQLRYSTKNENSLDLVLFLNGIPIFTAEIKNPLTGQDIEDAIRQYKTDRDPREPLQPSAAASRFAVDPASLRARISPGRRRAFSPSTAASLGAPAIRPFHRRRKVTPRHICGSKRGRATACSTLCDSSSTRSRRRTAAGARQARIPDLSRATSSSMPCGSWSPTLETLGAGQRYLIQHSAGSGKSFTIAWLAHQLSTLHDASDRRAFHSIVVITDRRVLDRQLQTTMRQFEQTLGVVENIDTTSRQLKEALESGEDDHRLAHKFPVIAKEIGDLPGKRFAVIVDEAHSSQSGESTKSLKAVLA